MGSCEGNWSSAIRWERENGVAVDGDRYVPEGTLHICPSTAATKVRVSYLDEDNELLKGTCSKAGEAVATGATPPGERFKLSYKRKVDDDTTYNYEGYGRILNKGAGPALISGRVTVAAEGLSTDGDTAIWDAVRIGGHGGLGTGEGGIANPSEATNPGGATG